MWPLLAMLLTVILTSCASATPTPTTPITLQLKWAHQAQFAGFYAADQLGYYQAEGLTVTLAEGGPFVDLIDSVVNGEASFGVASADHLIVARAEGQPVQAIATIYRRNPVMFMTLSDSGITRPEDFVGKTIQVPPTIAPSFHAMMARVGITPDQYNEIVVGLDLEPFYSGEVQVWAGYVTNQPIAVRKAGHEVNLIYPDDYGVHFYADTIFTTDEIIAVNPDLVRRFLHATMQGWTYAIENPASAADMVAQYKEEFDSEFEAEFLSISLPLINTGEDYLGWMKPEIWAGMEQMLWEQGVLSQRLDPTTVFTIQFLEEIYQK